VSIANVIVRVVGRRQAATPEVWIGTHCNEPECVVDGTLHQHRPKGIGNRIAMAERIVLHDLAGRTARTNDPWAAALEQFGGGA
jgi:hypothetical protein